MKRSYLLVGCLAVGSIFLFASALNLTSAQEDFLEKRAQLVIRKVGQLITPKSWRFILQNITR